MIDRFMNIGCPKTQKFDIAERWVIEACKMTMRLLGYFCEMNVRIIWYEMTMRFLWDYYEITVTWLKGDRSSH